MLRAALFDLDGTLLDTAPDFALALDELLAETGRAPMPFVALRVAVARGSRGIVRAAFGLQERDSDFEPMRQRFLAFYQRYLMVHTRPFAGIPELLEELGRRGIAWGVVTNKPHYLASPLLELAGLEPAHAALVCPDHVVQTKPDPEGLLLACAELGCEPAQAVYIGDNRHDVEAGQRAGMRTIAAEYGYLGSDESARQWGADFRAKTAAEVHRVLIEHFF